MNKQDNKAENNAPQFVTSDSTAFPREYASWLKDVKLRYRQAQVKAAIKVNTELLQFYWQLGKDIVAMHIEDQWGKGVMKQLSLPEKFKLVPWRHHVCIFTKSKIMSQPQPITN